VPLGAYTLTTPRPGKSSMRVAIGSCVGALALALPVAMAVAAFFGADAAVPPGRGGRRVTAFVELSPGILCPVAIAAGAAPGPGSAPCAPAPARQVIAASMAMRHIAPLYLL
jgi:hypothetical protein